MIKDVNTSLFTIMNAIKSFPNLFLCSIKKKNVEYNYIMANANVIYRL